MRVYEGIRVWGYKEEQWGYKDMLRKYLRKSIKDLRM